LGLAFTELPDPQCCGATFPLATDNALALVAPVRLLLQAQAAGSHVTTLCAVCFHVLRRTQTFLSGHTEVLDRINWFIEQPYQGRTRVSHFLELLRDDIGWDTLRSRVVHPLHKIKAAPYHGCLLLRPQAEIRLDDPEDPRIIHDCLAALGCEVVHFPFQSECCGSYLAVREPELSDRLAQEILDAAAKAGAEVVVTACPLCQFNLDYRQRKEAQDGEGRVIPVLYFTQLMAVALGLQRAAWGLEGHYVDPLPKIEECLQGD
jgi:heterodisulfide reductase subunit B